MDMREFCLIVVGALIMALGGLEWASTRALTPEVLVPAPMESALGYWP